MKLSTSATAIALVLAASTARAESPEAAATATAKQTRDALAGSASAGPGRSEHPVAEPALQELREDVKKLWSTGVLRRGTTAIYVVDVASGEELYAVHEDEPLNPASNVKLISTAAALEVLGPDWRYVTRVVGPAPDADGVVAGDVYLAGNYDPTLRAAHIQELGERMVAAGITRIEGDVLVGPDPRRDSVGHHRVKVVVRGGEEVGDEPTVEVTPANGFVSVVMEARTTRTRRARIRARTELVGDEEDEAGSGAESEPEAETGSESESESGIEADAETESEPEAGSGAEGEAEVSAGDRDLRYQVTISGKMGVGHRRTYRRWVPRRNLYTAHLLRQSLIDGGVQVTGQARRVELPEYVARAGEEGFLPIELGRHESRPVADIASTVNKRSINYMADRLVNSAASVVHGGAPDMEDGVEVMLSWLERHAGIPREDVVLDTGSGLSYETELSARQIVRVLRVAGGYAVPEPGEPADEASGARTAPSRWPGMPLVFRDTLAIGGVDGTLRRRFRGSPARRKIIGKTGTLTQIIALSGSVTLDGSSDDTLLFSIVSNGTSHRRRWSVRRQHEKIVEELHDYLQDRRETHVSVVSGR